ncbi:hypothetical protein QCD79_30895, partial [Pseudomonas quasicaspiana]|nr:hypothetical protein [Pseudomonas quasicaspiana]
IRTNLSALIQSTDCSAKTGVLVVETEVRDGNAAADCHISCEGSDGPPKKLRCVFRVVIFVYISVVAFMASIGCALTAPHF